MFNVIETLRQLISTSILGFVTKILSIFLSNWLDRFMNESLSNLLGLIINSSLDFWMMKMIFKVSSMKSHKFVTKYAISIAISIITAQLLFMGALAYTKKYHIKWYKTKWAKYVFYIRYVAGALAYGLVEFPLQKWWVFKK
jgi:hypothetical protein